MGKHKNKIKEEGCDNMTYTMLEKERVEYINGMKKYLSSLKRMPKSEAKKEAKESLYRSGILTKKGEYTAHYRKNMEK